MKISRRLVFIKPQHSPENLPSQEDIKRLDKMREIAKKFYDSKYLTYYHSTWLDCAESVLQTGRFYVRGGAEMWKTANPIFRRDVLFQQQPDHIFSRLLAAGQWFTHTKIIIQLPRLSEDCVNSFPIEEWQAGRDYVKYEDLFWQENKDKKGEWHQRQYCHFLPATYVQGHLDVTDRDNPQFYKNQGFSPEPFDPTRILSISPSRNPRDIAREDWFFALKK